MKVPVRYLLSAILFGLLFLSQGISAQSQAANPRQPVRVLYVEGTKDYRGEAVDPARGADFREFLEHNFVSVKTCKDFKFTPEMAKDVDVIVLDGDIRERVPADFQRPMILLGSDFSPLALAESRGYKLQNL